MKVKTINAIRDLALEYEKRDVEVAYELMSIAHQARPTGPLIQRKLLQYKEHLYFKSPEVIALQKMVECGDVAIIPIGFRCSTKGEIRKKLGITQASLPFDYGFFSPDSVASVIRDPIIQLDYNDDGRTHRVCIKAGKYKESNNGYGLNFELSSYEEIESIVTDRNVKGINKYLDKTFGYYTLDQKHQFVLAHYNWHRFADVSKSKGVTDPSENLQMINSILNNRIKRMFDLCKTAKFSFFIFGESQNYNHIKIGDKRSSLKDFSLLERVLSDKLNAGIFQIIDINEVKSAKELVDIIADNNKG
jgi:hypothetical protein